MKEEKLLAPLAPWPADPRLKRIGQYQLQNVLDGARGLWLMLRASGMSPEEVEQLIVDVKDEILDTRSHPYAYRYAWIVFFLFFSSFSGSLYAYNLNSYVIYGRKPFEGEAS